MIYVNIKDDGAVGYMAIVRLPEENNKYAFFNINKYDKINNTYLIDKENKNG